MITGNQPDLADRLAVSDLATRYARCLDAKDWAGFRACFTDVLETDFADFGTPAASAPADDFVAFDQSILADVDTQHLIVNHHVTIAGDEAVLIAEAIASHHRQPERGGGDYDVHGTYRMVMVRTAAGWRISMVQLRLRWSEGDPALLDPGKR